MIFEALLFLIWSAFFVATILGVWSEPQKNSPVDTKATLPPVTTNAMEIANQLW
ncbi:MAG: hypothetical protein NWR72_12705 [Bacteroidia bacterium]|nr:hypothetical protein [Bacteroidia bacterium]